MTSFSLSHSLSPNLLSELIPAKAVKQSGITFLTKLCSGSVSF